MVSSPSASCARAALSAASTLLCADAVERSMATARFGVSVAPCSDSGSNSSLRTWHIHHLDAIALDSHTTSSDAVGEATYVRRDTTVETNY